MTAESEEIGAPQADESGDKIVCAAFDAFMEKGYSGASMLEIATRARISKRDLYARFANKRAVLVACIESRSGRMRARPDPPEPRDRAMLAKLLSGFGSILIAEVSNPVVIAMFQFAIAEAMRSPEVAETLQAKGREAARKSLAGLIARAQAAGLLGEGDPSELADQYLGLLWEGLQVSLIMGVAGPPSPEQIHRRVDRATEAFLSLHPEPD